MVDGVSTIRVDLVFATLVRELHHRAQATMLPTDVPRRGGTYS
jgi:hypothetical protein